MSDQVAASKRLAACIELGNMPDVFTLLKTWPVEELQALVDDADAFYTAGCAAITEAWKEGALKPENFFSPDRAKALDDARDQAHIDLLAMCSEISSVAQMYLRESEPPKL